MGVVIERNTRAGAVPVAPRRPDGSLYRFAMYFDGLRSVAYADTPEELCEVLIPGYSAMSNDERLTARILYATRSQVQLQAAIAAEADPSGCTDEERGVLLGPRDVPPAPEVWQADVPLVLVDVYYEPQGQLARPVGRPRSGGEDNSNILWLSAVDESSLLTSLAAAGLIRFMATP